MTAIEIDGPWPPLVGELRTQGAKNSALPALAAASLAPGPVVLDGVPELSDLEHLARILVALGANLAVDGRVVRTGGRACTSPHVPASLSRLVRGSIYALALPAVVLGRGDIGAVVGDRLTGASRRRTDLAPHARAFAGFGMTLERDHEGWRVDGGPPRAGEFRLDDDGVSASALAILIAAAAEGRSVIHETSLEIEVDDTLAIVSRLGARVERSGRTVVVDGPMSDQPAHVALPPDRIHAGTVAIAAAATGGCVELPADVSARMTATFEGLAAFGVRVEASGRGSIRVSGPATRSATAVTAMYPGLATDLLPPLTVLAAQTPGRSILEEGVYRSRAEHVEGLRALGARIEARGGRLLVHGPTDWRGGDVAGRGIRETAALVLAGLVAEGRTRIHDAQALTRGYEDLLGTLAELRATPTLSARAG